MLDYAMKLLPYGYCREECKCQVDALSRTGFVIIAHLTPELSFGFSSGGSIPKICNQLLGKLLLFGVDALLQPGQHQPGSSRSCCLESAYKIGFLGAKLNLAECTPEQKCMNCVILSVIVLTDKLLHSPNT